MRVVQDINDFETDACQGKGHIQGMNVAHIESILI